MDVEEAPIKANPKKMLIFEDNDYQMKTLENLNQLRKSKQFCDAILQVGAGQDVHEIHAHRVVLASASPYLLDLFSKETQSTGHVAQYKLNGAFDLIAFKCLVNYAYTSKLEVPPEKLKTVYKTARKLKMRKAVENCGLHLITTLSPENCIGIRSVHEPSSSLDIIKKVDHYIRENISKVVSVSKELLALPQVQVELLQNTSEEIQATNAQHLCEMILDWVRQTTDEPSRLVERVHMLYLNQDDSLHDCNDIQNGDVQDSDLIQDYKKLSRRLSAPGSNKNSNGKQHNGSLTPSKPRNFLFTKRIIEDGQNVEVVLEKVNGDDKDDYKEEDWRIIATTFTGEHSIMALAIVAGQLNILSIVQRLNTPTSSPGASRNSSVEKSDGYKLIASMSSARCAVGTGELQGKLLVCGGYDRGECLKTVEQYDDEANKWNTLKPMGVPRGRFNIAVVQDKVYAIGGCDGSKELNSSEFLDLTTNKWKPLPNLPIVRSNAGVCQLDCKIYVIGGWNGQRGITRCDVFDPKTFEWNNMAPLKTGRYQTGAAAFDGAVYAVGGCDSWNCLSSVEKYDVAINSWITVAPLTIARRGCGVSFYNGKLYCVGGHDGVHSLCSTEIYDPETNTWTYGPSLTNCRANVGLTLVGDRLYAVGGFNGKVFLNTVEYLDPQTNSWTTFVNKTSSQSPSQSLSPLPNENTSYLSPLTNGKGDSLLNGS